MTYREGQFLSIELPDGEIRSYSMANAVVEAGEIELHIRLHPHGKFSTIVRDSLAAGDHLKVHGPFGSCVWPTSLSADERVVLLATGTGIAPINALMEAAIRSGCENPMWLYWGAESRADLYLYDRFEQLSRIYRNFHFIPVLNAPDPDPDWDGERGLVQEVAARHHADLSSAYVYACGAPRMVAGAKALLTARNRLSADRFFADAFESSSTAVPHVAETAERIPIIVAGSGKLEANRGTTLMETLRDARLIMGVCGGAKSCGTCRVVVDSEWFERLTPADRGEKRLLRSLEESGPWDRLACQVVLTPELADLQISIPL